MTTATPPRTPRSRPSSPQHVASALLAHLKDPMRRNAYALIAGTAITSGLGLVFWALAARWLDPAVVGLGASVFATVTFLANVATLGMRNGLIRFLPAAGRNTRRLLLGVYGVCLLAAAGAAGIFLLGQPLWAEKLDFLRANPLAVAAFVGTVMVWVLFILQDNVLIAFRRAVWVPIENAICSVGKIIMLPLVAVFAGWAVIAASVLPALVAVVIVTALLVRHAGRAAAEGGPTDIPVSKLLRFAATDHFAALIWMGTTDMLVLLVLHELGAEASAYYFMAATISYSLYLVTSNVGSALVAEGSHFPDQAVSLSRKALGNAARLVLPFCVLGIVAAPLVLKIFFGEAYAINATTVTQLLLASAVPQMIVGLSVASARIRHDLRLIIIVYSGLAVGVFGGSALLIGTYGLAGVGVASLTTQTLVAVALLITGRTGLWPLGHGIRNVINEIEQLPLALRRRRSRKAAAGLVAPALEACGRPADAPTRLLTSDSDTLVLAVSTESADSGARAEILKIATTETASRGLAQHSQMGSWLSGQISGTPAAALVPQLLARTDAAGCRVVLESGLPGRAASAALGDPRLDPAAYAAIAELHTATAIPVTIDAGLLQAWVEEPLDHLRRARSRVIDRVAVERVGEALYAGLAGRAVLASWTHGDFWPGNLLVQTDAVGAENGLQVSGLVDFENSREIGLPDTDLLHWWLARQPGELGATVRAFLSDPSAGATALESSGVNLPNPALSLQSRMLLTWLSHVVGGLTRAETNRLGQVWQARNVRPVLQLFAGESDRSPRGARR